jgi:DNA-binding transcriptional LysR family regulator
MELRHLRYFVATVECMSLREASRRIHVAQPAISQTISNLEAELRVKLLMRSGGRSVELTSEGQLFYQESLKTLKQADHSIEFVEECFVAYNYRLAVIRAIAGNASDKLGLPVILDSDWRNLHEQWRALHIETCSAHID